MFYSLLFYFFSTLACFLGHFMHTIFGKVFIPIVFFIMVDCMWEETSACMHAGYYVCVNNFVRQS